MKRFVTNVFTAVACLFLLSPAAIAAPLHIVAIGDSITQGRGDHAGSGAKWTPTYGWRYAFWKNCVDAAIECRMVGSMTTGFESTPEYPEYRGKNFLNCHEARWVGLPRVSTTSSARRANNGRPTWPSSTWEPTGNRSPRPRRTTIRKGSCAPPGQCATWWQFCG